VKETSLAGIWQSKDPNRPVTLALNRDGTGKLNNDVIKYEVNGNKLTVSVASTYTFSLSANTLTLSGWDLPQPLTFEVQGTASGEGLGAGKDQLAESVTPSGPVGSWETRVGHDIFRMVINSGGTGTLVDQALEWTFREGLLSITPSTNAGIVQVSFQLDGDTLVTTLNGQRIVYTRGSDSDAVQAAGGGPNPEELVGKWCYMSNVNAHDGGRMSSDRYFTLYANGTYEYYGETSSSGQYGSMASQESDGGTWSATATSITTDSRKHGMSTYALEKRNHPKTGDAMLVLDGDAYVTFHQRRPW
jgi:hypothetical protein